ncbi:hypothetical protein JCM10212_005109 [Sporobolomyces blumeae]
MASITFDTPHTRRLCTLPVSVLNEIYASVLQDVISHNHPAPSTSTKRQGVGTKGPVTRFHSKVPPPLDVREYLDRLTKFTPFPRDALLLSSVYLNRISHLALPTAYSDSFVDRPAPDAPHPRALVPLVVPDCPKPVMIVSPALGPTPLPGGGLPGDPGSLSAWSPPGSATALSVSPASSSSCCSPSRSATSATSSSSFSSPPPERTLAASIPSRSNSTSTKRRPAPLVNLFTVHRVVLSTLLVSTKFTCDRALSQSRAAKVGGVSTGELARLEGETLRLLGWEMYWTLDELEGVLARWVDKAVELGHLDKDETTPSSVGAEERGQGETDEGATATRGCVRASSEPASTSLDSCIDGVEALSVSPRPGSPPPRCDPGADPGCSPYRPGDSSTSVPLPPSPPRPTHLFPSRSPSRDPRRPSVSSSSDSSQVPAIPNSTSSSLTVEPIAVPT